MDKLNVIDIKDWDVSVVTNMNDMFSKCTSLDEDYVLKERRKKLDKIINNINEVNK